MPLRRREEHAGINMTPMIDVVFQMIIFFVLTVDLDKKKFDEQLTLAMAPHGAPVGEVDPRTVYVDLYKGGIASIGLNSYPLTRPGGVMALQQFMQDRVARYGQELPVVIRGQREALHAHVKPVMDVCKAAGLYRMSFSAFKEPPPRR